jgi:signal transduction histidine kinase
MTITTRLTLYFQLALGVVLVGFSVALYGLASWHVHSQAERHLQAALDQLIAAIEIHPTDVEWEPLERNLTLGSAANAVQLRWTLRDENGRLVDCSENTEGELWPAGHGDWLLRGCRVESGRFDPHRIAPADVALATAVDAPLPVNRTALRRQFTMTVGLASAPLRRELLLLAVTLAAISAGIWLTAALWGRWLCHRALRPVREMAHTARTLQEQPESDVILAVPPTQDEVADLGAAFNGVLGTLRDSIEQQRRFAGDASHQLRTPLAVMRAAADVALRRARTSDEYHHVLEVIQRRCYDLTQIVETLLSLARQGDGTPLTGLELVDLNQICQERIELWREGDRAADIELELDLSPVCVRSQPTLIGQIIDNLLDNAIKYSSPGSSIEISVSGREDKAMIVVRDHGIGMSPEEIAVACEPFYRSQQARRSEVAGAGLGLAIARRFAALAGGRLEVESQPGVGSQFRLVFASAVEPSAAPPRSEFANATHEPAGR